MSNNNTSEFSLQELTSYMDSRVERTRKEALKKSIESAAARVLPQIRVPGKKRPSINAPKCSGEYNNNNSSDCECQICRILRVEISKREPVNAARPFLAILAREKSSARPSETVVTEYWSSPFSSNDFRNGARKYGSANPNTHNDFVRQRQTSLIRDELNSMRPRTRKLESKYFFRDLTDLRQKLVARQDDEETMLHECPAPKSHVYKRFDVGEKYKQEVKLSKDVSEFIEKQRLARKRSSEGGSVKLRLRKNSLHHQAGGSRKNSDHPCNLVVFEPPILDDTNPTATQFYTSFDDYLNDK